MRGVVYALPLLLALTSGVRAAPSEVAVSYLVDARALRGLAVSHHVLTFELYADAQCREQLHRESVAAARIEVGTVYVRRAASSSGRAATLQAVLHPPRAQRGVFLVVRGPAVRPVGDTCQFQSLGL
jgi:hypothetical protein